MNAASWRGRPVFDERQIPDLDVDSAIHQFTNHQPPDAADDAAYQDYVRRSALDAAAHHLVGIRAAHAAGFDDTAREHASAYAAAAAKAGFDPSQAPPQEVADRVAAMKPLHPFKPHPADDLWKAPEPEVRADDAGPPVQSLETSAAKSPAA